MILYNGVITSVFIYFNVFLSLLCLDEVVKGKICGYDRLRTLSISVELFKISVFIERSECLGYLYTCIVLS